MGTLGKKETVMHSPRQAAPRGRAPPPPPPPPLFHAPCLCLFSPPTAVILGVPEQINLRFLHSKPAENPIGLRQCNGGAAWVLACCAAGGLIPVSPHSPCDQLRNLTRKKKKTSQRLTKLRCLQVRRTARKPSPRLASHHKDFSMPEHTSGFDPARRFYTSPCERCLELDPSSGTLDARIRG